MLFFGNQRWMKFPKLFEHLLLKPFVSKPQFSPIRFSPWRDNEAITIQSKVSELTKKNFPSLPTSLKTQSRSVKWTVLVKWTMKSESYLFPPPPPREITHLFTFWWDSKLNQPSWATFLKRTILFTLRHNTQHYDTSISYSETLGPVVLAVVMLTVIVLNVGAHIARASMSLCWLSSCWVPLYWASVCWMLVCWLLWHSSPGCLCI